MISIQKKETSRTTLLIISAGFLLIYLVLKEDWAIYVSLAVGILGSSSLYLSKKIEWIWLKIGQILGYIVPNILLILIFFLILYPLSLISKIFTKDPLMLSSKHESYFINVDRDFDKKSMENIW
ncbi:MAG: hypothetical protein H6539_03105 [Bacteroidales bacterium]|nr:hypothetical protein [Bacteroidales bacterium]